MIILGPFLLELQNGAGLVWGKVEKGGRYPHRSQSNSSLACVGLICEVDSCQGPDSLSSVGRVRSSWDFQITYISTVHA